MKVYLQNDTTGRINEVAKDLRSDKAKMQIGGVAVAIIQQRTSLGLNESGAKFPAYSSDRYYAPVANRPAGYPAPSGGRTEHLIYGTPLKTVAYDDGYGQYKSAIGRGSVPQLSVSGEMLGDMIFQIWKRGVIIYFATALSRLKARGHHEGKFPFFGITASGMGQLVAQMRKYMKRSIRKAKAA